MTVAADASNDRIARVESGGAQNDLGRGRGTADHGECSVGECVYQWRRLQRRLWVVRADGRHVGIIEQGHHFTVTDASERVRGGYRTFEDALDALSAQKAELIPTERPRRATVGTVGTVGLATVLGLTLGTSGLTLLH